jgi:hypothetical protein
MAWTFFNFPGVPEVFEIDSLLRASDARPGHAFRHGGKDEVLIEWSMDEKKPEQVK